MSDVHSEGSSRSLGRTIEILATIAMALAAIGIVGPLVGGNGLRLTERPNGSDAMMTIAGSPSPAFEVELGDQLATVVDDDGSVSVADQAGVEVGEPITVSALLLDPTPSQRVPWLIWQISGPLLALLIAWPIRQMARSTYAGDPFTVENERRLWRISGLVIGGGVAVNVIGGIARDFILQRSAAADLFALEVTLDFLPVVFGLLIAALASIWRHGVAMRDELDATI